MRRALLLATALTGCSFPDPTIDDSLRPDSGIDSIVVDTNADTSVGDTAAIDASTDASDTAPTETSTDGGDAADPCDKDKDGYRAKGDPCGGNDCDDNDPRANPGVGMTWLTFNASTTAHKGDWNCDGNTEKQLKINVDCGLLGGSACTMTKGFTTDPACGTSAKYVECATSGLLCVESTTKTEVQGCR